MVRVTGLRRDKTDEYEETEEDKRTMMESEDCARVNERRPTRLKETRDPKCELEREIGWRNGPRGRTRQGEVGLVRVNIAASRAL